MKINLNKILIMAIILQFLACSDQDKTKSKIDNNKSKPELSSELQALVPEGTIYTINNRHYDINTLPKRYKIAEKKEKKAFLNTYINHQIMLDGLQKEQEKYKDSIDEEINHVKAELSRKGITPNELALTLLLQRTTMDTIAYKEVELKHPNIEKEVSDFYQKKKNEYSHENGIEISYIAFADEQNATKVLKELLENNASLEEFSKIAATQSIYPNKVENGYVGFITEKSAGKEFFNPLWESKKLGLFPKVLHAKDHSFVTYIHAKKKAGITSLNEAHQDIKKYLLYKDKKTWLRMKQKKILKNITVKIHHPEKEKPSKENQ